MATVYKVELEVISDWIDLSEVEIKEILEERLTDTQKFSRNNLRVDEVKVKRKN